MLKNVKIKNRKFSPSLAGAVRFWLLSLGLLFWSMGNAANTILTNDTTTTPTPIIYLGNTFANQEACSCLNNATNLTNGQFETIITVEADTNQTWTIASVDGLYDSNSPAPPASLIAITAGKIIPEVDSIPGTYQLHVIHEDAIGFSITLENEFGEQLSTNARCYYPNPTFMNIDQEICISSAPFDLQADVENAEGMGMFFLDGNPITSFDPDDLGPGNYSLSYTFDAGEAANEDASNPGCITTITEEITVEDVPFLAVIDHITLAMNNSCEVSITPELMLAGTYPCIDDYYLTVYDSIGIPIGETITSEYIGQTLTVLIESEGGGFSGIGHVSPVDYRRPEIECMETRSNAEVPVQVQFVDGNLSHEDTQLNTTYSSCFQGEVSEEGESEMHYYDLYSFKVDQDDVYTFEFEGDFRQGPAFLYQGISDLSNGPCLHIVAKGQERRAGRGYFTDLDTLHGLSLELKADQDYSILTTSYYAGATGEYRWVVYSARGGKLKEVDTYDGILVRDLLCSDLDSLYNNESLIAYTGMPVYSDNCMAAPHLSIDDQIQHFGECGIRLIQRAFKVEDQSGNTEECMQDILFRPPTVEDVVMPPLSTIIECDALNDWDENGNPHPDITGYPFVQTALGVHLLSSDICNLAATYIDNPPVPICESGYKILRVWSVFDWCDPTTSLVHQQQIRVGDLSPPSIECVYVDDNLDELPDTLVVSTSPFDCTASFELPLPIVNDNCSSTSVMSEVITDVEVLIYNQWGFVTDTLIEAEVLASVPANATSRMVEGIPLGQHRIRYQVTDACGNSAELECPFIVEDQVAPTAICSDDISISIGGDGEVLIDASQLNDGSVDNCSFSHVEVRRQASACSPASTWGDKIPLNCCDVSEAVVVEVRAIDEVGNENNCQVSIFVSDQLNPQCQAPPNVELLCTELPEGTDLNNLTELQALFGTPSASDNCFADWQEFPPNVELGECGTGTVIRQFQAVDTDGNISTNSCQQSIQIMVENHYSIKFPRDISLSCDQEIDFGPEVFVEACDLLAVSYEDIEYPPAGNERYRLFRTYNIINWCEYDGVSNPLEVKRDEDCDEEGGEEDVWLNRLPEMAYIDADDDITNDFPYEGQKGYMCDGTTNPSGYWRAIPSIGYWQYTQVIKIYDNTAPELSFITPEPLCTTDGYCEAWLELSIQVEESCTPDELNAQLWLDEQGNGLELQDISDEAIASIQNGQIRLEAYLPIGSHRLELIVNDGFENETITEIVVEVLDCGIQEPVCSENLVFELLPNTDDVDIDGDGESDLGYIQVFAEDLVVEAMSDCTEPLQYAINHLGAPVNLSQHYLNFSCADTSLNSVEIHIWDAAFNPYSVQLDGTLGGPNFVHCFAQFYIEDPENICNPIRTSSLAGQIYTENGDPLPEVLLQLEGFESANQWSNSTGDFLFEEVLLEEDYTLTPEHNENPKNGISTFDLILVTKHILGVQPLNSPYKIIAADVDNSGSVSIVDLITIRKVILSILDHFPNNNSWRFVDADYEFPISTNPWHEVFPEQIAYQTFAGEDLQADFIAIKVGDVNVDAYTGGFAGEVENRNLNDAFPILMEVEDLGSSNYQVHFSTNELSRIQGFQLSLSFDQAFKLGNIEHGLLQAEHIGSHLFDFGALTASWHRQSSTAIEVDSLHLFSLSVQAPNSKAVLQGITLTSRYTQVEAYNHYDERLPIRLLPLKKEKVEETFQLFQNRPNPFRTATNIPFQLASADWVRLEVHDHFGQQIWTTTDFYEQGRHEIQLNELYNLAPGVYYYTLIQGERQQTKKMLKL